MLLNMNHNPNPNPTSMAESSQRIFAAHRQSAVICSNLHQFTAKKMLAVGSSGSIVGPLQSQNVIGVVRLAIYTSSHEPSASFLPHACTNANGLLPCIAWLLRPDWCCLITSHAVKACC